MLEDFRHDTVLSHSPKEKPAARAIPGPLREDGLRVWFDESHIKLADSIPMNIGQSLLHSRVIVLCVSASGFASDQAQWETGTFPFRDRVNKNRSSILGRSNPDAKAEI